MRLSRIHLSGFKSFAHHTVIELDGSLTVIVGPNGSGKSNIVDAIRWMLGEHSLKSLRASSRDDVIFAGSETHPPAVQARVALELTDGHTKWIIERFIDREKGGGYAINGQSCRLRDIQELLKGTGLGREFYAIVGQGQVERVASASPETLHALLEEAADIAHYKERKREALVKMEATQMNLDRLNDRLQMLGEQKRSLYLKAKRAEKYLEYSALLKEKKTTLLLFRHTVLKKEFRTLEQKRRDVSQEIKNIQKELVEVESQWRALRDEFANADNELRNFGDVVEEYKKRQSSLLEIRDMYAKRLSQKENALVEVVTRLEQIDREAEELEKRRSELAMILQSIEHDIEEVRERLAHLEEEQDRLTAEYGGQESELVKLRNELTEKERLFMKLENEASKLSQSIDEYSRRIELLKAQIQGKHDRLNGLLLEIEELEKSLISHGVEEKQLNEELSRLRQREIETKEEQKVLADEKEELVGKLHSLQIERKHLVEQVEYYHGYSHSVRRVFENRSNFPGLVDTVGNLLDVPREYEIAIGVLLGNRLQDIVVQSSDEAKRIVEFLKVNNFGRVTLLPMDLMTTFTHKREKIGHPGFVGYAADLVRLPPELSTVEGYLFGNDMVVRTLDDAVEIRRRYNFKGRIVSLDGQLVSGSGAITGGSTERAGRIDLISRRRRIDELTTEIEELEGRLHRLENEIQSKIDLLIRIDEERRDLERRLVEVTSKGASVKMTLRELQRNRDELVKEVEELEKLLQEYNSRLEGFVARKETVLNDLAQLEKEKERLRVELETLGGELQLHRRQLDELKDKIVEEKLTLTSHLEKRAGYESEISTVKRRLEEGKHQRYELSKKQVQLAEEIDVVKEKLRETERELDSLKSSMDSVFASFQERRKDQQEKMKKIESLERTLEELKTQREEKRELLHNFELSLQEIEMELRSVNQELEKLIEDFDPSNAQEVQLDEETAHLLSEEVSDLENRMRYIGSVDLDAVDEYNRIEAEYEELAKQKEDLEKSKKKLKEIINLADSQARTQFMETFEEVSSAFDRHISLLFEGGHGELKIVSAEDLLEAGVEISVKKPGRGYQKLHLLSGGEKALVAIALIFALMEKKPSPFYILDEIDSALDDFNTERLKKLLMVNAQKTQFVIITHNKLIMEIADLLQGITMEDGVSRVIPVRMEEYSA